MKWKERVGIAIAVGLVLLTSVLVLDIRYAEHLDHQEPMLRHGTNRLKSGKQFQRQFLNEEQQHQQEQQQQQPNVNGTYAEDQLDPATVSNPDDPLAMQRLVYKKLLLQLYYCCHFNLCVNSVRDKLRKFYGMRFQNFHSWWFVCVLGVVFHSLPYNRPLSMAWWVFASSVSRYVTNSSTFFPVVKNWNWMYYYSSWTLFSDNSDIVYLCF